VPAQQPYTGRSDTSQRTSSTSETALILMQWYWFDVRKLSFMSRCARASRRHILAKQKAYHAHCTASFQPTAGSTNALVARRISLR
jgi:hypothetical protein